ncbi:FtsX-like permease family protein [Myxococcus sp. CA040A]|uniref:FtsX-like permease family protein n=1 Tax=Myxococcus sp. CA040A TaxID=2741738 RepID=UPI00157B0324|nr:FtsX-like permease family protein [Myxococcus sp. CA040A]
MTLLSFALQSVVARPRSWVVALLALGSALLLTLGLAMVAGISEGTQRSVIESGAGHFLVYNSQSTESAVVVTGPTGAPVLVPLPDYPATEARVRETPGVSDVVPLEVGMGATFRGNYLDDKLSTARAVARQPPSPERDARLARLAADLQRTLRDVARDADRQAEAFLTADEARMDRAALEAATTPAFWERFGAQPLAALEYLENHVARQVGEGESIDIEYLGSDLNQFVRAFPRFELVTGTLPPPGHRGLLLGHGLYEQRFKLPVAARLDELKRELDRGALLAEDERLRTLVDRASAELPDLLARVDAERSDAARAVLTRVLGHPGEAEALWREFLQLDDANFATRHQLFYAELAPLLPLYRVKPGDTVVLKGLDSLVNGVPLKIWGTYRFRGLGGDSSRVNTLSLMDLVSARYLSGRLSPELMEEAKRDAQSLGLDFLPESEVDLLKPATVVEVETPEKPSSEVPDFPRARAWPETFSATELRGGSVLQAAVVVTPEANPEAVALDVVQRATSASVPLTTVDWEAAGGFVSEVVGLTRVVLLGFSVMLCLFVVLVSAGTLLLLAQERVGEVGTMRAVGMQRSDVFGSLLTEGLLLGGLGAGVGLAIAAALLFGMMGDGIGVTDESLQFFMGGPVLMPRLSLGQGAAVWLGVVGVVVVASLVPAWRGSSVPPAVAMRKRED